MLLWQQEKVKGKEKGIADGKPNLLQKLRVICFLTLHILISGEHGSLSSSQLNFSRTHVHVYHCLV